MALNGIMSFMSEYYFPIKIRITINNQVLIFTNSFLSADDRDKNRGHAILYSLSLRIAGLNDGNTSHNRENNGPEPRIPPYRLKNEKKDGLYAKYGVRLKSL